MCNVFMRVWGACHTNTLTSLIPHQHTRYYTLAHTHGSTYEYPVIYLHMMLLLLPHISRSNRCSSSKCSSSSNIKYRYITGYSCVLPCYVVVCRHLLLLHLLLRLMCGSACALHTCALQMSRETDVCEKRHTKEEKHVKEKRHVKEA